MRLPVSRVYRAFPELDRYSDEQCARFIRAARQGKIRRTVHTAIIGLVFFLTLIVSIWLAVVILEAYSAHRTLDISHPLLTWYGLLLNIVTVVAMISAAPLLAFFMRDFFLLRQLRYVLRTRGVCVSCRYSLVGLDVGPELRVICPECGETTTVDPSLGELTTDPDGRARFRPESLPPPPRRFLTDRRIARLKRHAPLFAAVFILLPLLLAGSYEAFLRRQAGIARRERPGAAALEAIIEKFAPSDTRPSDPNVWDFLDAAAYAQAEANTRARSTDPVIVNGQPVFPQFEYILNETDRWFESLTGEALAHEQQRRHAARDLALRMIEVYREAGVYALLDQAAAARRTGQAINHPANQSLQGLLLPHLGDARSLTTVGVARMRLARERGDLAEFRAAFEANLTIRRALLHEPFVLSRLLATYVLMATFEELRLALLDGVPPEWIDEAHEAIERQWADVPHDLWIESERIAQLDCVAWLFSDVSNVRFGRWSPVTRAYIASVTWSSTVRDGRLAWYTANRNAWNEFYDWAAARAAEPPAARTVIGYPDTGLLIVDSQRPNIVHTLTAIDRDHVNFGGTLTMLALERFRASCGTYPDSLDELVPDFLPSLPLDPWSEKPFGYRRIDPATDGQGRAYLLYSIGSDATDNGGHVDPAYTRPDWVEGVLRPGTGEGSDYIINTRPIR